MGRSAAQILTYSVLGPLVGALVIDAGFLLTSISDDGLPNSVDWSGVGVLVLATVVYGYIVGLAPAALTGTVAALLIDERYAGPARLILAAALGAMTSLATGCLLLSLVAWPVHIVLGALALAGAFAAVSCEMLLKAVRRRGTKSQTT